MRPSIALFLFLALVISVRADDKIAGIQQSLKDQGFYYGEITGEKNADTTAAIRRYQIRNGLQITGELNDETLRSLRGNASASSQPTTTTTPSATPDTSDLRDDSARQATIATPAPTQPVAPVPQDQQPYP